MNAVEMAHAGYGAYPTSTLMQLCELLSSAAEIQLQWQADQQVENCLWVGVVFSEVTMIKLELEERRKVQAQ